MIQSAYGGTRIESWVSAGGLAMCGIDPWVDSRLVRFSGPKVYNVMLNPLLRQTIKGVLWYQGAKILKNLTL